MHMSLFFWILIDLTNPHELLGYWLNWEHLNILAYLSPKLRLFWCSHPALFYPVFWFHLNESIHPFFKATSATKGLVWNLCVLTFRKHDSKYGKRCAVWLKRSRSFVINKEISLQGVHTKLRSSLRPKKSL